MVRKRQHAEIAQGQDDDPDTASSRLPASPASPAPAAGGTVSIPAKKARVESPRYPGEFKGLCSVDGSRLDPDSALAAAKAAESHESSDRDIQLNIFVDGSAEDCVPTDLSSNVLNGDIRGGYAVVHKNMAPGAPLHGEVVRNGWYIFPAIDINLCEGLAITQALELANMLLRKAINDDRIRTLSRGAKQGALLTLGKPIKVNIFSDSKVFLGLLKHHTKPQQASSSSEDASESSQMALAGPGEASGDAGKASVIWSDPLDTIKEKEDLFKELIQRAIRASKQLQELPGVHEVELELHWIPSHIEGMTVQMHEDADKLAKHCRKSGMDVFQIGGQNFKPRPSVLASLTSPLLVPPADRLALQAAAQDIAAQERPPAHVVEVSAEVQILVEGEGNVKQSDERLVVLDEKLLNEMRQEIGEGREAAVENRRAAAEDRRLAEEARKLAADDRTRVAEAEKAAADERATLAWGSAQVGAREQSLAKREQDFEARIAKDKEDRIRQEEEKKAQVAKEETERAQWKEWVTQEMDERAKLNEDIRKKEQALVAREADVKKREEDIKAQVTREEKERAQWKDLVARETDERAKLNDDVRRKEQALVTREDDVKKREEDVKAQVTQEEKERVQWNEEVQRTEQAFSVREEALKQGEEALAAREAQVSARENELMNTFFAQARGAWASLWRDRP